MNVKKLIDELSKYPDDVEVQMAMKVDMKISIVNGSEQDITCYPKGVVYGVSGITGGHNEVIISGS